MKKLLTMTLFLPMLGFAQVEEVPTGKIELGTKNKNFFIKDGEGFNLNQYKEVFSNEEAIYRVERAKTNKNIASVLTYSGSVILGLGVGVTIYSKSKDGNVYGYILGFTSVGFGTGLLLSSIPLWMGYSKNIKKAVDIENGTSETAVSELKLNVNGDGIGLAYQF